VLRFELAAADVLDDYRNGKILVNPFPNLKPVKLLWSGSHRHLGPPYFS
jgi:hypothetical protein